MKNRAHNVHPDILETLLVLNLKDVNLDEEKEQDIKQKKLMARKQKVLQMSKRERKVCSWVIFVVTEFNVFFLEEEKTAVVGKRVVGDKSRRKQADQATKFDWNN